jgi:hypothetical protein
VGWSHRSRASDPSYIRFAAEQPNECWQSDFTHYRLTRPDGLPGPDTEIVTWLDDHSRYALHVSAHVRITAPIVLTSFRNAAAQHGYRPPSSLSRSGSTVRSTTARLRAWPPPAGCCPPGPIDLPTLSIPNRWRLCGPTHICTAGPSTFPGPAGRSAIGLAQRDPLPPAPGNQQGRRSAAHQDQAKLGRSRCPGHHRKKSLPGSPNALLTHRGSVGRPQVTTRRCSMPVRLRR